jgi:hypothetical protein
MQAPRSRSDHQLRPYAAPAIIRAMAITRFAVLLASVASLCAGQRPAAAPQPPAAGATRGTFRFEAPAKLTVSAACAIGLKNGDVLVVLTDAPIACAAAAKSADPQDAVLNAQGVKARVHFTVDATGKLGPVFLANVSGASTYTDDAHGVLKAGPKTAGKIAGAVSSGGVHKVQLHSGAHDMEYDLAFDTPIVKAAR